METQNFPSISVIIPAASEENYIGATLQSIIDQEYPILEIIVVVNGSKDITAKIARSYTPLVFEYQEALGPSEARNRGAKMARGDILLFVDADTILDHNVSASVAQLFKGDSRAIGSLPLRLDHFPFKVRIYFGMKNFLHRINLLQVAPSGVFFSSRQNFIDNGGFNKEYYVGEFNEYIARAQKKNARYIFLHNCAARTSSRRVEKKGVTRTVLYWTTWAMFAPLGLGGKIAKRYWK